MKPGQDPSVQKHLDLLSRQIEDISRRLDELEATTKPAASLTETLQKHEDVTSTEAPVLPPPHPVIIPPQPEIPPFAPLYNPRPMSASQVMPFIQPPSQEPFGRAEAQSLDIERLIGGKWFLWLGVALIFLVVGWSMQYAWVSLGPWARINIGFCAGLLLLAAGSIRRNQQQKWFTEGITGAGLGVIYLTIWAAASLYGLIAFEAAFVLMGMTTALGVVLAVVYDSLSLIVLSLLGGYLAPAILNSGHGASSNPLPLLIYIAILNSGIVVISLLKQWRRVIIASYLATVLLVAGWLIFTDDEAFFFIVFCFFTVYFIQYLAAACFSTLVHKRNTEAEDIALLFLNAFAYTVAGMYLLSGHLGNYPAIFPIAMAALFGGLGWQARHLPTKTSLRSSFIGLMLCFLMMAVPVQLQQRWIAIAWTCQAAALITLGAVLQDRLLRTFGQIVWWLSGTAVLAVLTDVSITRHILLINEQALPLLVWVLATAWMSIISGIKRENEDPFRSIYTVFAVVAAAWLAVQETFVALGWHWNASVLALNCHALYIIAVIWAVLGAAVYTLGKKLSEQVWEISGLTLATLAISPLFIASVHYEYPAGPPFWNVRWFAYLGVAAALAYLAYSTTRSGTDNASKNSAIAGFLRLALALVLLAGSSLEIYADIMTQSALQPSLRSSMTQFIQSMLWAIFSLGLLVIGIKHKFQDMKGASYCVGIVSVMALLSGCITSWRLDMHPIWNSRAVTFIVNIVAGLIASGFLLRDNEDNCGERQMAWLIQVVSLCLLGFGLTQETFEYFHFYRNRYPHWELSAQMGISIIWTLLGVAYFLVALWRRMRALRLMALGVLTLTASKLFLLDLAFLDGIFRILSFGALGITLVGISWLYSYYEIGKETPEHSVAS